MWPHTHKAFCCSRLATSVGVHFCSAVLLFIHVAGKKKLPRNFESTKKSTKKKSGKATKVEEAQLNSRFKWIDNDKKIIFRIVCYFRRSCYGTKEWAKSRAQKKDNHWTVKSLNWKINECNDVEWTVHYGSQLCYWTVFFSMGTSAFSAILYYSLPNSDSIENWKKFVQWDLHFSATWMKYMANASISLSRSTNKFVSMIFYSIFIRKILDTIDKSIIRVIIILISA